MNIVIGLCHDDGIDKDTFSESVSVTERSDREGHESFELLSTDSEKVSISIHFENVFIYLGQP